MRCSLADQGLRFRVPIPSSAPANYNNKHDTRSAFSKSPTTLDCSKHYVQLLQLDIPGCREFYMGFCLSSPFKLDPRSQSSLSDTAAPKSPSGDSTRLNEYQGYTASTNAPDRVGNNHRLPPPRWLTHACTNGPDERRVLSASLKRKYAMDSTLRVLEAHKIVTLQKIKCNGQQAAWGACGKWCVAVSSPNVIAFFRQERGGWRMCKV